MAEYKEFDRLRVTDPDISGGYFKQDQIVVVKRGDLMAEGLGPVVSLYDHDQCVWTIDQFDKVEETVNSVVTTNTPRSGETPEQTAARARGSDLFPSTEASVRTFGTGATRDLDANKLDYEGFLSPLVLKRYAEHMHKARKMSDGTVRASDNWQLGIPMDAYMKSLFRHFFDVWSTHRGYAAGDIETELCALLFNANGYLHEHLKEKRSTNAS